MPDSLKMVLLLLLVFGSWGVIGALNAYDINKCVKGGETLETCMRIFTP